MDRIENLKVKEVFNNYPEDMRKKLMFLRQLILETASEIEGVNSMEETLKWGGSQAISQRVGVPSEWIGKKQTQVSTLCIFIVRQS